MDSFRQLLAMTPDERETFLTNRPPEIRARIIAKIAEYEALDPNERELRLRATDLRWYLMPLLRESPTNRTARLAQIPVDMRELVQYRLDEWTILPPMLKEEFLENEHILAISRRWTRAAARRKILAARQAKPNARIGTGFPNLNAGRLPPDSSSFLN